MSSKFRLDVTVGDNANGVIAYLLPSRKSPVAILNALVKYFGSMVAGSTDSSTRVVTSAVSATGTVVFSSFVQDDTVTVGATTLTGRDTPANENQFAANGNDAADATAFAACVNAHSVLSKYLSAAKTGAATVTLTSLVPGVIGNAIILAISAHGSVGAFASGAEDTPVTVGHGI